MAIGTRSMLAAIRRPSSTATTTRCGACCGISSDHRSSHSQPFGASREDSADNQPF
jgi:hypothetical protein